MKAIMWLDASLARTRRVLVDPEAIKAFDALCKEMDEFEQEEQPERYAGLLAKRQHILDTEEAADVPLVMKHIMLMGSGAWMRGYGKNRPDETRVSAPTGKVETDLRNLGYTPNADGLLTAMRGIPPEPPPKMPDVYSCHPDTWALFPDEAKARYDARPLEEYKWTA